MTNSADPDQLASSEPTDLYLRCLQRQGISGFSRTRVNGLKAWVAWDKTMRLSEKLGQRKK